MSNTGKTFKVKVLQAQTIYNGTGQSLVLSKGDIGTAHVYGSVKGTNGPQLNVTNLLINFSFNGKSINIESKGSDPKLTWDQNLVQMLSYHENGKPKQFEILPDNASAISTSRADGSSETSFFNSYGRTPYVIAGGGAGLLAGLYIASKSENPTAWTYIGHGLVGFVLVGASTIAVTKVFEMTKPK